MAVLGRGIAVVEHIEGKDALVVLWKRLLLRIARKDIILNQQYIRWECEANYARENNSSRKLSLI